MHLIHTRQWVCVCAGIPLWGCVTQSVNVTTLLPFHFITKTQYDAVRKRLWLSGIHGSTMLSLNLGCEFVEAYLSTLLLVYSSQLYWLTSVVHLSSCRQTQIRCWAFSSRRTNIVFKSWRSFKSSWIWRVNTRGQVDLSSLSLANQIQFYCVDLMNYSRQQAALMWFDFKCGQVSSKFRVPVNNQYLIPSPWWDGRSSERCRTFCPRVDVCS